MTLETPTTRTIVSLDQRRSQALFPALAQVEAYWEGLRNGRQMPARAEIDPRGLTEALGFAFLLERIAPGLARIRVAGQHLSDLMGMEVRGMPVSAMFLPAARAALRDHLETCFARPARLHLTLATDAGFGRPALEAQIYLAPLRDRNGLPTRALGALQCRGRIGRPPRRFSIRSARVNALGRAPGRLGTAEPPNLPGDETRARRPAPEQGPAHPGPAKPGLRLVYSAHE